MIGYRKIDGQWVECDSLNIKELRLRASRYRNERIIAQAQRAKTRLNALCASCKHEVVNTTSGHTFDVTTCVICGQVTLT